MIRFLTNFDKDAIEDVKAFIKISELTGGEIKEDAYDFCGNRLPDKYALYCEHGDIEATKAIERYFFCVTKMNAELEKIYIRNGVPEELLKYKFLYRGCEKKYFPEYNINYSLVD